MGSILRTLLIGQFTVSLIFAADISVLPSPGKSVAIATADQPGKWLVMTVDRTTFFFTFPNLTLLDGGKVCVWEGVAGVYGVVFDGENGTRQTTNVVLGGPPPPPVPVPVPVPDGLWELTKITYQKIKSTGLSINIAQIIAVSGNYHDVASDISVGKITTDAEAKSTLKQANQA